MKKITMLSLVMLLVATTAFAQEKGELNFSMGGGLVSSKNRFSGSKSSTNFVQALSFGYLMNEKVQLDAGVSYIDFDGFDDSYFDLMLGGRYYYFSKEKMRLNGGLDLDIGFGYNAFDDKGKKVSSPIDIIITPIEFQYWPMEGGALFVNGNFTYGGLNLGDTGANSFGINTGVMIRLK